MVEFKYDGVLRNGVRLEDGSRPWQMVGRAKTMDDGIDPNTHSGEKLGSSGQPAVSTSKTAANPWTLEGQQIGAILQVMQAPG